MKAAVQTGKSDNDIQTSKRKSLEHTTNDNASANSKGDPEWFLLNDTLDLMIVRLVMLG